MARVAESTLQWSHKPFDVVTDEAGNTGFIREVSVNECQDTPGAQISYAVEWLIGNNTRSAWFAHEELTAHGNLLLRIAECACHPMGGNHSFVKRLFNAGDDNVNR